MSGSILDPSRKFFLSSSCVKDKKRMEYTIKVLGKYKIQESRIYTEMDTSLINSGDYLIRCFGRVMQVWQIEVIPFGIATRFLHNLSHDENSE